MTFELKGKVVVPIGWIMTHVCLDNLDLPNGYAIKGATNRKIAQAVQMLYDGKDLKYSVDDVIVLDSLTGKMLNRYERSEDSCIYTLDGKVVVNDSGCGGYYFDDSSRAFFDDSDCDEPTFNLNMIALMGKRNSVRLRNLSPITRVNGRSGSGISYGVNVEKERVFDLSLEDLER
jgi:hypothetical protein